MFYLYTAIYIESLPKSANITYVYIVDARIEITPSQMSTYTCERGVSSNLKQTTESPPWVY